MAILITFAVYSSASDVWSFGVVIYEIYTRAGDPYPGTPSTVEKMNRWFLQSKGMDPLAAATAVAYKGLRLPVPQKCPKDVASIMQKCFETVPEKRPTFQDICLELGAWVRCSITENFAETVAQHAQGEANWEHKENSDSQLSKGSCLLILYLPNGVEQSSYFLSSFGARYCVALCFPFLPQHRQSQCRKNCIGTTWIKSLLNFGWKFSLIWT